MPPASKGVVQGVVRRRGTHIPNDVGVAEVDAKRASRVDAGVHAREHEVLLGGGQGEVALGEGGRVGGGGGLDVLLDGAHVCLWAGGRWCLGWQGV